MANIMTSHAKVRASQRGIPPLLIDLLLEFGSVTREPGGVERVAFDKAAKRRLRAYCGGLAGNLEGHLAGIYGVLNEAEVVVTVGHRVRRFKRH